MENEKNEGGPITQMMRDAGFFDRENDARVVSSRRRMLIAAAIIKKLKQEASEYDEQYGSFDWSGLMEKLAPLPVLSASA